jgi:hypothetical protein
MISFLAENWQSVVGIAGAVVMVSRIIVRLTPTPADDTFMAKYILPALKSLGLKID